MLVTLNPGNPELTRYYAERAGEYERIYLKPERQEELALLKVRVGELLAGHHVLELACGTGYWTEVVATQAASILALDLNEEVLAIARSKDLSADRVRFAREDAFTLQSVEGDFSAGFAGFWWSHVAKDHLPSFLNTFHSKLAPGALVVFIDNNYVEGSSTPISRTDAEGNTYQQRRLENGDSYEILKNFPDEGELRQVLREGTEELVYERLKCFWLAWYRVQ